MTGITDPTEEYFKDGLWGWDGTRWRKLPLLFGYLDRYAERVYVLNAIAGINYLYGTTVPAGEIWVINAISGVNTVNVCAHILLGVTKVGVSGWVVDVPSVAAGRTICVVCSLVLKAGDKCVGCFDGCTAGDDLYLDIWGYKMALT